MQDLCSTDPTHKTHVVFIDHADYTGPIRQRELDHTKTAIDLPCLTDLHHEVGIDHLYDTDRLAEV